MDKGTAIVGIIIIALSMIPMGVIYINRKRKDNRMIQNLKEFALQKNGMVTKYELCGDFAISLDENRNDVFFAKKEENTINHQNIILSDIKTCQAVIKKRKINDNHNTTEITDRIELSFIPLNRGFNETKLLLYDAEVNMQLGNELRLVEIWSNLINNRLNTIRTVKNSPQLTA